MVKTRDNLKEEIERIWYNVAEWVNLDKDSYINAMTDSFMKIYDLLSENNIKQEGDLK